MICACSQFAHLPAPKHATVSFHEHVHIGGCAARQPTGLILLGSRQGIGSEEEADCAIVISQVPSPPDDGEAGSSKRTKGSSGAIVGRWQETPSRSGSAKELRSAGATQPQASAAAEKAAATPGSANSGQKQGRKLRERGAGDGLQVLKYFHLVPAQVGCPAWKFAQGIDLPRLASHMLWACLRPGMAASLSPAPHPVSTARHHALHSITLRSYVWCVNYCGIWGAGAEEGIRGDDRAQLRGDAAGG